MATAVMSITSLPAVVTAKTPAASTNSHRYIISQRKQTDRRQTLETVVLPPVFFYNNLIVTSSYVRNRAKSLAVRNIMAIFASE